MSATSLVYRTAWGYELVMRALYGRHYGHRMRAVAEQVPDGASVLECCCGPATLYRRHLKSRTSGYIGLDINPRFVDTVRHRGLEARLVDVSRGTEPLPAADVALIQASLYHFLPNPSSVIDRMLEAARTRVIVSEPIRNLADSRWPAVAAIARHASNPGGRGSSGRFDEAALDALMHRYRARTMRAFTIPGGREKVYVLSAE